MCSFRSSAVRTRATAASMFGNKNGSLNERSRGRKKVSTSSAVENPLRMSKRAMQFEREKSLHEIGPPFNSSGGAMIHRFCTDHPIRCRLADKIESERTGTKDAFSSAGRWKATV